jgi:carbon starvation protein
MSLKLEAVTQRERFALVTIAPAAWLVVCTTTAGLEKVFSPNPNV